MCQGPGQSDETRPPGSELRAPRAQREGASSKPPRDSLENGRVAVLVAIDLPHSPILGSRTQDTALHKNDNE